MKQTTASPTPKVHIRRSEPQPSRVFDTYWTFAAERQAMYFARLATAEGPWTTDKVLAEHRFTNVYRAADRVSQFLIRHVIYTGSYSPEDIVFRVLLFKIFNKIDTWQLLSDEFGELTLDTFDVEAFDRVLCEALMHGVRIYSAAYIMPNGPKTESTRFKHRTHLDLLAHLIRSKTHLKILEAPSMRALYDTLLSIPSIGPFLAYQYSIDLMYSPHLPFSENDFVQPGPGALNGIAKCFVTLGDYSPAEAIAWVAGRQQHEFSSRGLLFGTLWGRPLHLIDCQNLFCEVDKYARVAHPEFSSLTGRTRIKQKYSPSGVMPEPWFPPKWNLNPMAERFMSPRVLPRAQMTLPL